MKRLATLALMTVFALSAAQSAFAHSSSGHAPAVKSCGSNHCGSGHCKTSGPPKYMGGSQNGPIGTPENPFKPTPISSNGFVFVNGHWERPRAGQATIVDPTLNSPVVRDHRGTQTTVVIDPNSGYRYGGGRFGTPAPTSTSIVGDHRGTIGIPVNTIHPIVNNNLSGVTLNGTILQHSPVVSLDASPNGPLSPYGGGHGSGTKIVRDHRGPGGAQGPSSVGPNNVTGVGADPISEGISWLVNGVGSLFDNQVPDPLYHKPTGPVDHRH